MTDALLIDQVKAWVRENDHDYITWEDVVGHFDGEIVQEELAEQSRWNTMYEIVMRFDVGKEPVYLRVYDVRGSTEYQDREPISDSLDELVEVQPYDKTVVAYRPI